MTITSFKEQVGQGLDSLKSQGKKVLATLATVTALSGALTSCDTEKTNSDKHSDAIETIQPRSWSDSLNYLDQQIANKDVGEEEKFAFQESRDEILSYLSLLDDLKAHIGKPIYAVKRLGAPGDITYYYTDKETYDLCIQNLKTAEKWPSDWCSYDGYEELEVKPLDHAYLDLILEEYATNPLYWVNMNDFFRSQIKK